MGLFSFFKGEDVTNVATSVSRVVSDTLVPDSIKTGTIKAIFADGDPAEYVMEELTTSIALRAERMFNYAETKYAYGSPSGDMYSNTQGRAEVEEVLETLESSQILLDYVYYGSPNVFHIALKKLVEEHAYTPATNKLENLSLEKNKDVYVTNLQVFVPASLFESYPTEALEQWGTKQFVTSSTTVQNAEVRVDYYWTSTSTLVNNGGTGSIVIPVTDYVLSADYFHAKYTVFGKTYYWMYAVGLGTYPTLDALFNAPEQVNGQFFPFAHIRSNKQAMDADVTTAGYKTTQKLLKYVGIDFGSLVTSVHTNPDIADIEQAMLIMAVPPNTTNKLEQLYLFDFFNSLFYATPAGITNKNAIVIQDKLFKMALSYGSISKSTVTGNIGKVGTLASGISIEYHTETYTSYDNDSGETEHTRSVKDTYHYYRKQVSSTVYEEVRILDLTMVYYIWNGYNVTANGANAILLIPLDHSITKKYSLSVQEKLYSRSMHYVFNSRVTTHLSWYETGLFRDLLTIAAVVVSVITLQPEIAMMAIAVSAGTMTLLAFAWAVAYMTIIPYIITSLAVKYFIKAVGIELTFIVAIVAAVYGVVQAYEFKSLAGAPWASDLLKLSSNLTKGISDAMQQSLMDLSSEAKAFGLQLETELKSLDNKVNALDSDNRLTTLFVLGELPAEFFQRTVHSGNIGMQSIEAIGSYVDIALKLPKISDTIESNLYA